MSGRRLSGSFMAKATNKSKSGKAIPRLVKWTEAALIVAFFVCVALLKVYYWTYTKTERFRCLVMSIMPIRTNKEK